MARTQPVPLGWGEKYSEYDADHSIHNDPEVDTFLTRQDAKEEDKIQNLKISKQAQ